MKKTLKRFAMLSVAMLLAFAGCEDDFGQGQDRDNNGGGSGGGVATGTISGHDYVDLGLPSGLKWATCNVGATTPEDYGNYYAWGETTTKSEYSIENSLTYGRDMGDISGNVNYDAARANWGSNWRMPTKAEMEELRDNCTWTWITQGNVNGMKVTGPNGNSIFLPAAGYCNGSSHYYVGEIGHYWSSTPNESDTRSACFFDFGTFDRDDLDVHWEYRSYGHSVRPVSGTINYGTTDTEELPTVTTNSVTSITKNSAQCGGNVTSDGGATVTERGVCWSTYQNPTIYDNTTHDGTGTGVFTSHITNLSPGTTYYVRAYATNSQGTAYGNQISFTTQSSGTNPGITVNFGGNSWEAAGTSGLYYASPGAVTIDAYSDATGQEYPIFTSGLMITTSGTYTDAVTEELDYADGIIAWLEYWEATYWTLGDTRHGDWWAKNATINVTELDLTAMSVSMNINATMFEFADVVVMNGTTGSIDMSLLPGANTRSLSVNVTQVSLQSAKQSFNKKTISIVK